MQSLSRAVLFLAAAIPFVGAAPVPAAPQPNAVPGKYIVLLKSDLSVAQVESHTSWVSDIHTRSISERQSTDAPPAGVEQTYGFEGFHAYAGSFDDATVEKIKSSADVSEGADGRPWHAHTSQVVTVEPDYIMHTNALTTQTGATWGLGRISHRARGSVSAHAH